MIRKPKKLSFRLSVKELEDYSFLGRRVFCSDFSSLIRKALKELLERHPAKLETNGSPCPTPALLSDVSPAGSTPNKKRAWSPSDKSPGRAKRRTK